MRVLVLGSGGREHALAWKIAQASRCEKVYLHPGNSGTTRSGLESLPGNPSGPQAIATAAKLAKIELVVIGPETLLAEGYADWLRNEGFLVVGPGREGARLESSKLFAKEFMQRAGIPTAPFTVAHSEGELVEHLSRRAAWPVALKLDGLAAGKGVVIATKPSDGTAFAAKIWREGAFGPGPHCVVIEEFLHGREVSLIGLCDGKSFVPLPSATDFKRVGDGDTGPNTGGMGSLSPSPYFSLSLGERVRDEITTPILKQLSRDGIVFRGALYVGLMVSPKGEPFVLEFNTRFGDPETQAILPRINGDFLAALEATARGELSQSVPLEEDRRASVYIVAAAEGYPDKPRVGDFIEGLADEESGTEIFFAGVSEKDGRLVTSGGRVLGVGALADGLAQARDKAYRALTRLRWPGMHYRRDIGGQISGE